MNSHGVKDASETRVSQPVTKFSVCVAPCVTSTVTPEAMGHELESSFDIAPVRKHSRLREETAQLPFENFPQHRTLSFPGEVTSKITPPSTVTSAAEGSFADRGAGANKTPKSQLPHAHDSHSLKGSSAGLTPSTRTKLDSQQLSVQIPDARKNFVTANEASTTRDRVHASEHFSTVTVMTSSQTTAFEHATTATLGYDILSAIIISVICVVVIIITIVVYLCCKSDNQSGIKEQLGGDVNFSIWNTWRDDITAPGIAEELPRATATFTTFRR